MFGIIPAPVSVSAICSSNTEIIQIIPSYVSLKINNIFYSGFTSDFILVSIK